VLNLLRVNKPASTAVIAGSGPISQQLKSSQDAVADFPLFFSVRDVPAHLFGDLY
jgi:hypothetical protein